MSRALHLINFLCIIALFVLMVKQWKVNDQLHGKVAKLTSELVAAEKTINELHTQVAAHQNESERLAVALTASKEETQTALQKYAELVDRYNQLGEQATALQDQLLVAHSQIKERDTRLKELADTLSIAQQRLDQAAERLKDEER